MSAGTAPQHRVPHKWRPSLAMIVFAVLATVLALPLVSLFFLRLYENQLIRQAEGELVAQSVALAALAAVATVVVMTLVIGFLFWRTITWPMRDLVR